MSPRVTLRFTWIAMLAAVVALLALPALATELAPPLRVLLAPAEGAFALARRLHWMREVLFLPFAAFEIVAVGVAVDALRTLRARQRGARIVVLPRDALLPFKLTLAGVLVAACAVYWAERETEHRYQRPREIVLAEQQHEHDEQARASLAALEARGAARRELVLVIGDSVAATAFADDARMEELLAGAARRPLAFGRVAVPAIELVTLENLFERLLALEPDLVVIEANLLFAKSAALGMLARAPRWAERGRQAALRLLPWLEAAPPPGDAERDALAFVAAARGGIEQRILWRWQHRLATRGDPNYALGAELIRRAQAHGARVAIAAAPVTARLREFAPAFFTQRDALTRELARKSSCALLFEDTAPEAMFADSVHLGAVGRARYSARIVPSLVRVLDTQGEK